MASLLSQVRARHGPGATVGVLGTEVPRLVCLRPAAWLKWWPSMAHLRLLKLKTLARARPRGADDARLPQERPHQAGSRGGGEIKTRIPREVLVTQAMTIETRRAPACSVLVSSLVQRGQAQAKASGKGYRSGAARPRPAEQQDGGHRGAQDGIITSAFGSQRPTLVRITCTICSPSKWPLLPPFPLNIWEEA